jgi:uncharacterized protein YcbX
LKRRYDRRVRVDQLWRYPVKSVGGEPLAEAVIGPFGVDGDRVLAVLDEHGEITWAGAIPPLMRVRAVTLGAGVAELVPPHGERFRSDAPDAAGRLSAAVDAKVRLVEHRPDNLDAALHVVTTAALRSLAQALPDSAIDATRFRPNLVLDERGAGYPEHGWIGRRMAIGALRLRFTELCDRCVMITKETPTVPHDRAVLRWVAREVGNAFGVYARVEAPARIRIGDEARWLD